MKRERFAVRRVVFLLGAIMAMCGGCGVGRNMVVKAPETRVRAASVEFSEIASPVSLPTDIRSEFQGQLNRYLYQDGGFQRGPEIGRAHV